MSKEATYEDVREAIIMTLAPGMLLGKELWEEEGYLFFTISYAEKMADRILNQVQVGNLKVGVYEEWDKPIEPRKSKIKKDNEKSIHYWSAYESGYRDASGDYRGANYRKIVGGNQ